MLRMHGSRPRRALQIPLVGRSETSFPDALGAFFRMGGWITYLVDRLPGELLCASSARGGGLARFRFDRQSKLDETTYGLRKRRHIGLVLSPADDFGANHGVG